jgi:hypothetical protein
MAVAICSPERTVPCVLDGKKMNVARASSEPGTTLYPEINVLPWMCGKEKNYKLWLATGK